MILTSNTGMAFGFLWLGCIGLGLFILIIFDLIKNRKKR